MRTSLLAVLTVVLPAFTHAADYMPDEKGNSWTYKFSNGMESTATVVGHQDVNGVTGAVLETRSPQGAVREVLASTDKGIFALSYAGQAFPDPVQRLKLPFRQGEQWQAQVNQGGQQVVMQFGSAGSGQIETPAGKFDCVVVDQMVNMGGQQMRVRWCYADGVGLVQQIIVAGENQVVMQLTKYNVKQQAAHRPQPGPQDVGEVGPPEDVVEEAGPAPRAGGATACPACNAPAAADAKFCSRCGAKIVAPQPQRPQMVRPANCQGCGNRLSVDAKFCGNCGKKVEPVPAGGPTPGPDAAEDAVEQDGPAARPAKLPRLEKYVSKDGMLMLYKPVGWQVSDGVTKEGLYQCSTVDPDETHGILFCSFTANELGKEKMRDSVDMAKLMLTAISGQFANRLRVLDFKSSKDRTKTWATVSIHDAELNKTMHGRFYFFYAQQAGTLFAMMAEKSIWPQKRELLSTLIANIAYSPQGVEKVLQRGRKMAEQGPAPAQEGRVRTPAAMLQQAAKGGGVQVATQRRQAGDGSVSIEVPAGWDFKAGRVQVLMVDNPQSNMHGYAGVQHSIISQNMGMQTPGQITAPYQPPPQALELILREGQIGRDVQVIAQQRIGEIDPQLGRLYSRMAARGMQVDARVLHVRFTNAKTGKACRGLFSVTCSQAPMNFAWYVQITGSWAPDAEYDQYLPLYYRITQSMNVSDQWMANETTRAAARQQQLNAQLQSKIGGWQKAFDGYMEANRRGSQTMDYISWAWSQTTLGQGSWVARNEGNEVYQADGYGLSNETRGRADGPAFNYTNFTGQNPWTGEQMEEINTFGEWQQHINQGG